MPAKDSASNRDVEIRRLRTELGAERARYLDLYDEAPVGYCDVSREMLILRANRSALHLLGATPEAVASLPISHFVAPEDRAVCEARHKLLLLTGDPQDFDLRMVKQDGTSFWAHVSSRMASGEGGAPVCRVVLLDVTEQHRAETGLRQLARAVEQTPASIVITDRAGNIEYVNAYFEQATGYTKAEAIGKNPRILKSGTTPPQTYADLWRVISEGREWRGELCNRRKNGELYWEYAAISGLKDEKGQVSHYIAVKDDITDRKRHEEALRVSLREKESLLRETHHRVKNNLALIASLMRLEAGRGREPETRAVLAEMQTRIQSVVLLNETLYKTSSYARVKLADYLRQIATHVFQAQNSNSGSVGLNLDLEAVEVETGQAIPCGLIVNELLTNSLKHAFPNGRSGAVRVVLRQQGDGSVLLRVSDTGAGLPEDFASRQSNSLGLQLVSDLARQLLGALDVGPGATFTITFARGRNETGAIPRPPSTRRETE